MRETRQSGSVEGGVSDHDPYSDSPRDGTSDADNCSGWTSTQSIGIFGITFHADYAGTANYTQSCSTIGSVYCVQQ
jgi:hypothetical protein